MKINKEKIIISIVIILLLVLGVVSYAAFSFVKTGTKINTIISGSVKMSYVESDNVISLEGALPTTDKTGIKRLNPGEYFDFAVSSSITGTININYEIAAEELSGNTIDGKYIKYYLTKVNSDGTEEEVYGPTVYTTDMNSNTYTGRPANMMSLYIGSMSTSSVTNYRLRLYVDESYNPQNGGGNLVYKTRINVYGLSGEKPSIAAGVYDSNGKMIVSWDSLVNDYGLDVSIDDISYGAGMTKSSFNYIYKNNPNLFADMNKVVIHSDVSSVGVGQFSNIAALKEVIILDGINSVAGFNNSGVEKVQLPETIKKIESLAFSGCTNLKNINIPNSVEYVGGNAFANTIWLNDQLEKNDLLIIGKVLYSCSNTVNGTVNIPEGITTISDSAFYGCSGVTSINIPSSVTTIGASAFSGTSITSIDIPDTVTNVSWLLFAGCTKLEVAVIPKAMTSLNTNAFSNCASLRKVIFHEGVTSIGYGAFKNCTSLTQIAIPSNVVTIGDSSFVDCANLTTIYYSGTAIDSLGNNWGAINAVIKPYSEAPAEILSK